MSPMNNRLMRPRQSGYVAPDADARAYIARVEAEDGQKLEPAVAKAINDFVAGLKSDGIFDKLGACCILMGARTLDGALEPLVGTDPTNNSFLDEHYNRKTGLLGNGSSRYIDTGRADNADGQNDCHKAVWVTTAGTANFMHYIGARSAGQTTLSEFYVYRFSGGEDWFRMRSASGGFFASASTVGFKGMSRSASGSLSARTAGTSGTITETSVAASSNNTHVFATGGSTSNRSDARIAFYSVGSALTLTTLESRVSTLYNAIGAAIP